MKKDYKDIEVKGSLGKILAKIAEKEDLSLTEMAKKGGLSAGYMSKIKRGLREPSFLTVRRILNGCGYRLVAMKEMEGIFEERGNA